MAGARITVDVTGINSSLKRLGAIADAGRDLRPLFAQIGEYLVDQTKERFRDERDPQGRKWKPLSNTTKARKKTNKDRILTEHGFLGSQISWQSAGNELLVGSNRIYAGTHQFGAKKGQYKSSPTIPWGDIPARPFLDLSNDDIDFIGETISDYLAKAGRV